MAINWERLIAEANTDKYQDSPLLLANTELLEGNLSNFRLLFLLATSIQNGIGLTRACNNIGLSVIKLTEWFTNRPELKEYFYSRRQKGYYLLVNKANIDASEMNILEWQRFNTNAARFNPNLVLWQEYSPKDQVNPEIFLNAFRTYYVDELDVATSIGFTYPEYLKYITSYPTLQFCIKEEMKAINSNRKRR